VKGSGHGYLACSSLDPKPLPDVACHMPSLPWFCLSGWWLRKVWKSTERAREEKPVDEGKEKAGLGLPLTSWDGCNMAGILSNVEVMVVRAAHCGHA